MTCPYCGSDHTHLLENVYLAKHNLVRCLECDRLFPCKDRLHYTLSELTLETTVAFWKERGETV